MRSPYSPRARAAKISKTTPCKGAGGRRRSMQLLDTSGKSGVIFHYSEVMHITSPGARRGIFQPMSLAYFSASPKLAQSWPLGRGLRAETDIASPSRAAGRGNDVAADHFRGRHRLPQLSTGSPGRHAARARDGAQHPPAARCGDAAHDRRPAGAGADQLAAQRRFRQFPPHRIRLPRPVRQGRRGAGGRPRRTPGVLLADAGHREPAAAQQSRDPREGVRDAAAAILQPVLRRGETAADHHRRYR